MNLSVHFFGDRFAGIIRSLHANFRRVALVIEVAFRISISDSLAARADERSCALHLATRRVGDLGFKPK